MAAILAKLGSVFTRFRKQKTTIERLEQLDKDIKEHEKCKHKNDVNQKKYIGALLLYSIMIYIIGAIFYYMYLIPKNFLDRLKTIVPFVISPLIIYSLRKFLKWFFIKRNKYYEQKLVDLKEEKRAILEEVKEKETYKKAREILDRFSNGVDINITPPITPAQTPGNYPQSTPYLTNTTLNKTNNLVQRNIKNQIQQQQQNQHQQTISNKTFSSPNNNETINFNKTKYENMSMLGNVGDSSKFVQPQLPTPHLNQQAAAPPNSFATINSARTLLPRPIIAPNRTFLDKILDFVIGEGPNNRYALICKSCHFHNGMALKEEFEYCAFRCAYCLFYNEARKTKLSVPKLTNVNMEVVQNESSNSTLSSTGLDDLDNLSDPISLPSSISASDNFSKPKQFNEKLKSENRRKGSTGDMHVSNDIQLSKKSSKSSEKLVSFENFDSNKENLLNGNNVRKNLKKSTSESTEAMDK